MACKPRDMLQQYYATCPVRRRMLEFLGGTSPQNASCVYLTADGRLPGINFDPRPTEEFFCWLDQGCEIARSRWDRKSLLAHLDIEYVNFDYPPGRWRETYDRTPLDPLPQCARQILLRPNDLLLKPAAIRHLVRALLSLGWHPQHIAGLIRSRYERDYGWGPAFLHYDAATRADFYTRAFAGLVVTGRDELADFTCHGWLTGSRCDPSQCNAELRKYARSIRERIRHERLASRPFNGLFLPEEHP